MTGTWGRELARRLKQVVCRGSGADGVSRGLLTPTHRGFSRQETLWSIVSQPWADGFALVLAAVSGALGPVLVSSGCCDE